MNDADYERWFAGTTIPSDGRRPELCYWRIDQTFRETRLIRIWEAADAAVRAAFSLGNQEVWRNGVSFLEDRKGDFTVGWQSIEALQLFCAAVTSAIALEEEDDVRHVVEPSEAA